MHQPLAQSLGGGHDKLLVDIGVLFGQIVQHGAGKTQDSHRGFGIGRCDMSRTAEQQALAEQSPRSQRYQRDRALPDTMRNHHLAAFDDHHRLARITLVKQVLPGLVFHHFEQASHHGQRRLIQLLEQPDFMKHLVYAVRGMLSHDLSNLSITNNNNSSRTQFSADRTNFETFAGSASPPAPLHLGV